MKIYLIPGLGCDIRVFSELVPLLNFDKNNIDCMEWLSPKSIFESIENYAQRVTETMPLDDDGDIILIGLSLGGMIATEISKLIPYKKLIIISSIVHQEQRPLLLKLARFFPIYHLVPASFTQYILPKLAFWLGISNKKYSDLFHRMLLDRSPQHLHWSRTAAVHWLNQIYPTNYIHIHGTSDHLFPHKAIKIDYPITNGTHNMILDRAEEIALIVNQEIEKIMP